MLRTLINEIPPQVRKADQDWQILLDLWHHGGRESWCVFILCLTDFDLEGTCPTHNVSYHLLSPGRATVRSASILSCPKLAACKRAC
jgi:hypothetical protein